MVPRWSDKKIKNYLIFVSLMEGHLNSSAILKRNLLRAQSASTHLVRLLKTFFCVVTFNFCVVTFIYCVVTFIYCVVTFIYYAVTFIAL